MTLSTSIETWQKEESRAGKKSTTGIPVGMLV